MRAALFALCLTPMTASAQSLLESAVMMSEYASAYATFGMADMSYDWERMVADTDTMLTRITGRWVNAGMLAAGPEFPVHILERACANSVYLAERDGELDLVITRNAGNARSLNVSYSYIFARSFQVSADMDEVQDLLGINDEDRPYRTVYMSSGYRGIVEIFHPSPRILVIQPETAPAEIYMRCP
jgi:hypothetical protein